MNLKLMIGALIELAIAALVIIIAMIGSWEGDTLIFSIIFSIVLVVLIPVSIFLREKDFRIGIYNAIIILFYMIAFYIMYPDTLFNLDVGGFLILLMLPLIVFVLIPLFTYEVGVEVSPRLITKWALIRFFLVLISFVCFVIAFSILWIPETNEFAIKTLIPGALLFSPFIMFAIGYACYELFGKISEFEILKHHRFDIILSYLPWIFILLRQFPFSSKVGNVLKLSQIVAILIIIIRVFTKKKMFERVFDRLFDYNPIKPRKNWYNKWITHIILDLIIFGAVVYLVYMILSIFQITPVYSWELLISYTNLTGSLYIPIDPYLEAYFFVGFIVNFTSSIFVKESVFSKAKI